MFYPEDNKTELNLWDLKKNIKGGYLINIDTAIVRDFIGLQDINGKDIYEGDIVKVKWHCYYEKAIIIFYTNSWCIDMSKFYPLCKEGWVVKMSCDMEFKKIGNIYENPELLESK